MPTAVPGLWAGWDMFVLVCSMKQSVSHVPTGWPQENGPTNVGAMVKTLYDMACKNIKFYYVESLFFGQASIFEHSDK